ncbi:MAG: hypothetical protein SWH68_07485 [Thermodesulfobacteriota bacterium]|nr:hypothetical protein [Thermodesulfobacteriota bacterium]
MRLKPLFFIIIATTIGLFIASEIYLRFLNHRACFALAGSSTGICRHDAVLGWTNKEGEFTFSAATDQTIHLRLRENGRRAVSAGDSDAPDRREKIILVGGSFIFGQGLSDMQTFGWKLQQRLPAIKVLNYGVQAYSTYQSLLMLERILPHTTNPAIVIYGFMNHHLERNIAPTYWRAMLNQCNGPSVYIPYATVDKAGRLIHHPPETYTPWPLTKHLKIAQYLHIFYDMKFNQSPDIHPVMQRLLLEMQDWCQQYECQFFVAFLNAAPPLQNAYSRFCDQNNIKTIRYDLTGYTTNQLRNPADGHPNEMLNTLWAGQTSNVLSPLITPQK